MKPRRHFHYLCILLLLFAQQSALSHVIWHATERTAGQAGADAHATHGHAPASAGEASHDHDSHHDEPAGGHARLCAFDLSFGQMLGGVHGACALPIVAALPASIAGYVFNPRLGTEAVPALSRGPPRL